MKPLRFFDLAADSDPPLDRFARAPTRRRSPWSAPTPHETVVRMLNNLVRSYAERGDLTRALRAAGMRLPLTHGRERE